MPVTMPSASVQSIHSVSHLRWKPQDIAVGASLGAACGVIFWGFNFAYAPLSAVMSAILPGLMSFFHALWYFSGMLALLVIRKPGAAVYVNLVGGVVEGLIGSQFSIASVVIATLLEGLSAEIPFAIGRYRIFNLPMSIASGFTTALIYGLYLLLFYFQGVAFLSVRGIVHMIAELVGGVLIGGIMSWYLFVALAKTGVLDRMPSGQALKDKARNA